MGRFLAWRDVLWSTKHRLGVLQNAEGLLIGYTWIWAKHLQARAEAAVGMGCLLLLLPQNFGFCLARHSPPQSFAPSSHPSAPAHIGAWFPLVCQINFSRAGIHLAQFSALLPARGLDFWISWVGVCRWSAQGCPLTVRPAERPERRAPDHP